MRNVRNCKYFANDVYMVDYYDKTIDLNRVARSRFHRGSVQGDAGSGARDDQLSKSPGPTASATIWR